MIGKRTKRRGSKCDDAPVDCEINISGTYASDVTEVIYAGYQGDNQHCNPSPATTSVIGVPANDFLKQEPGSNEEIAQFCKSNYKVTFPMMAKVVVKGEGKTPLYEFLTSKDTNLGFEGEVSWNFEKFLVGRDGKVVGRFKSKVAPTSEEMIKAVKAELAKK